MNVFDRYARYYDLLYRDKDYLGEVDYVLGALGRYGTGVRSILELGCGTGRHAELLAKRGMQVVGVDQSDGMLARARVRASGSADIARGQLEFVQSDIRDICLGRKFDAVIALFHVMSYVTDTDSLCGVFRAAKTHLVEGGLLLFDCWYGPCVLTERPSVRILRLQDDRTDITRIAEPVLHPNENTVDVNYHVLIRDRSSEKVDEIRETHRLRYFFVPELEQLLSGAGLSLLSAEEWMTGRPPGCGTWGVCLTAKA